MIRAIPQPQARLPNRRLSAMKTLFLLGAAVLSTVFVAPTLAEKIYTWTGSDGVVHYSEKPPTSGNAKVINVKTRASQDITEQQADTLDQQASDKTGKKEAEPKPQSLPTEAPVQEPPALTFAQKRENCERARQNLQALETRTRILTTDPETGEQRALPYEERAEMMIKSREQVRKYCTD